VLDDVARLADHVVLLEHGRVSAIGALHDILTRLDLSPAREPGAEAVIEARVSGHDEDYHLTRLTFAGGELWLPREDLVAGAAVRVRVAARDVSLTLERSNATSILNVLPATVAELVEAGPAQVLVRLDCGGVPLLGRVTRRSAVTLGLQTGTAVFAQVKSVALAK
jgi:molybdate transport system ATP-binding protein